MWKILWNRGKFTKGDAKCFKSKKLPFLKEIIIKKTKLIMIKYIKKIISTFIKFGKDNTTLNLLINSTRGKISSIWTATCKIMSIM